MTATYAFLPEFDVEFQAQLCLHDDVCVSNSSLIQVTLGFHTQLYKCKIKTQTFKSTARFFDSAMQNMRKFSG